MPVIEQNEELALRLEVIKKFQQMLTDRVAHQDSESFRAGTELERLAYVVVTRSVADVMTEMTDELSAEVQEMAKTEVTETVARVLRVLRQDNTQG